MSRGKTAFAIVAAALVLMGGVFLVAACVRRPSSATVISPRAFRFLMVSRVDKRFAGESGRIYAVDRTGIEPQKESDLQLYLDAASGKYPAARANRPFLLLGQLPGGGHPSKCEYRVVKVNIEGNAVECDLDFTLFMVPGDGPSVPEVAHFIAEMPPLPGGSYAIAFKVIASYVSRGDGKRQPEDGKRDHLAREPYRASFSVAP